MTSNQLKDLKSKKIIRVEVDLKDFREINIIEYQVSWIQENGESIKEYLTINQINEKCLRENIPSSLEFRKQYFKNLKKDFDIHFQQIRKIEPYQNIDIIGSIETIGKFDPNHQKTNFLQKSNSHS